MQSTLTQLEALARARTLLFVPGNRPERFVKALASGADAVVLDLEDSVPLGEKHVAREAIQNAWSVLHDVGLPIVIRMNPPSTKQGEEDLDWLSEFSTLTAVMVPKVESVDMLNQVSSKLSGVSILPLIESAEGLFALNSIAGGQNVLRLVVGHIDFMADTGLQCSDLESELTPLRFEVAMATRRHKLKPAIDGVTVQIDDDDRLRTDALRAIRFGFSGKLCIHPRQVAIVHDALRPTSSELDWARRVIAADNASGGAAVMLDGRMVDLPVVLQAQRTLGRTRF